MNNKDESYSIDNISVNVETHVKDSHGNPLVKPHVEPNVETHVKYSHGNPSSGKAQAKTTEPAPTSVVIENEESQ